MAAGLTEVCLCQQIGVSWVLIDHKKFIVIVRGPSDVPFSDTYPKPVPMTEKDIIDVEDAFVAAIERCKKAGCASIPSDLSRLHLTYTQHVSS